MNYKNVALFGIAALCLFFNLHSQTSGNFSSINVVGGSVFGGEIRHSSWNFKLGYYPVGNNVYLDFNNKMYFRNIMDGSKIPLLLQSDGSIGVNVESNGASSHYNTQGFKLAVNGGILCEEIKVIVDVPKWDVVFEPDYKMMSLSETESYIKTHKHLPDFPSALEFKKNGYKLGEMDGLLLKKAEELTLHVIRIQKELDAVNQLGNQLEEKSTLLEEQVKLLKEENEKLKAELEINK